MISPTIEQETEIKHSFNGINGFDRVCIPCYMRIMHLYAIGYSNGQITAQVREEFMDLEPNSISVENVKKIISNNRESFDAYRVQLFRECRDSQRLHTIALFNLTHVNELEIVREYNEKMMDAVRELKELQLDAQDDNKNYINTSRIFVLMEFIEKFHKKAAEFIGTSAMRDVEAYRQKMDIKNKNASGGSLIPSYNKEQEGPAVVTQFHE